MSKNKQPKMAFTRKPCVIATGIAISLMAAQSFAQTPAPAAATEKVEKIEVTGSRIPSANLESTSPVTSIDAQAIKIDGVRSVENIINFLPQAFAAQGSTISNGSTGTATVNLRGLGANRTLVLVNGRRLPYGSATSAAADLNQIPAGLIRTVDVLTGGAGALYGSDAVAGVVNFIMNDKFEGVLLDFNQSFYNHKQQNEGGISDIVGRRSATNPAQFSVPGDKSSDGGVYDASILMGGNFAGNKGNATAYLAYKKDTALLQSERDFSACSIAASAAGFACGGSGTNATGRITNLTNNRVFTNGANGAVNPFANATDQYNFGPLNYFQRPSERYSAAVFANYDVHPVARIFSEFMFTDYRSVAQIAPGGAFGTVTTVGFDNPLLSPAWRTALGLNAAGNTTDVVVQRRNVEGGGRQSEYRNTSYRTVLGVKGDFATNWSYSAFFQTSKVVYQQQEKNYFSSTRLARALDVVNQNGQAVCRSVVDGSDTSCVPYNVWRLGGVTPDQLAYLSTPGIRTGSTQQTLQSATLSSDDLSSYGLKLPSAKNGASFVVGFERRTDKLELNTDGATASGDLSGSGGPTPPLSGKTEVKDFFTQFNLPLVEGKPFADSLRLELSYRYSDYDTGKKTDTFGAGIDWAPIKQMKVRGGYQKAVRAPNVIELFTAQGLALYDNDADPCAGATPSASLAACQRTGVTAAQYGSIQDSPAGQYNFLQGGNTKLTPEKSNSYTFGFVFTPMANLSGSIDYFNIKVDDTISNVNPVTTLNECLKSGDPRFCSQITRDRLGTLWLLPEARIIGTNVNIGKTKTSGIDLGLMYLWKMNNGLGNLMFDTKATYLDKYEVEEIKGRGTYDCAGLYGNTCGVQTGSPAPRFRHKSRVTWASLWDVDLSLTWRHFSKVNADTTSSNPQLAGTTLDVNRTLAQRNYFDLATSWRVTKMITVGAGINNILDKDPPVTAVSGPSIFGNGNTFPQVYDALGRRFFFNLTAKF